MTQRRSERHQRKSAISSFLQKWQNWLHSKTPSRALKGVYGVMLTLLLGISIVLINLLAIPALRVWLPDRVGDLEVLPNSSLSSPDWLETGADIPAAFPFDTIPGATLSPLTEEEEIFLKKESAYLEPAMDLLRRFLIPPYVEEVENSSAEYDASPAITLLSRQSFTLALTASPWPENDSVPSRWVVSRMGFSVEGRTSPCWLDMVFHPVDGFIYARFYEEDALSGRLELNDTIRRTINQQSADFISELIDMDKVIHSLGEEYGFAEQIHGFHLLDTFSAAPSSMQTQGLTCVLTYEAPVGDAYFLVYYDMSTMQVSGFSYNYR